MKLKTDTTWRITCEPSNTSEMQAGPFFLYGPDGVVEDEGQRPRLLAKYAWAEGAEAVVHDYDLTKDPEN